MIPVRGCGPHRKAATRMDSSRKTFLVELKVLGGGKQRHGPLQKRKGKVDDRFRREFELGDAGTIGQKPHIKVDAGRP